jgi:GT2 family glycosyltransferase
MIGNTFIFPIIRRDFIAGALASLRRNTPDHHKVIVVNQTRYNDAFDKALWEWSDVVIRPSVNYGFAQAANLGTRLATTEFVTICNDDVIFFNSQWWAGVRETFDRFPKALGVLPMSPKEPGWGYGEPGYRWHATLDECLADPDGVVARLKEKWNGSVVDGAAMWCITFKRAEWVELGMYDERFFPGGSEDYDACARAYQAGYRILSSSYSFVWHHWGQSKDEATGFDTALPNARAHWVKLSTKGFGDAGLWHPDCDVWGKDCERTDPNIWRESL